MLAPDQPIWDKADEIKEVEHKCDFLTHEIIQRLNRTFVTPLDREDIHALARSLDDVMDAIDASAALVRLYHIDERAPRRARAGAASSRDSAEQVRLRASRRSRSARASPSRAVEINRLENEADRAHQAAGQALFDDEKDPIAVMKWKEILDFLEAGHRPLRGRRQRARGRRRQARLSGWTQCSSRSSRSSCVALAFDYINGFHDAANSIATVVSTRVLSPGQGGRLGGVLQLRRGVRVRHRRRQDRRHRAWSTSAIVTFAVIFAGLIGAIIWDLITWYFGLPTSSSHALIGGYAGAAVAKAGFARDHRRRAGPRR